MDMKRVNIRVTKQVDDWFTEKSERTGLSKSALMYLALESYMQQSSVVDLLPEMIKRLEYLERNASGAVVDSVQGV